MLEDDIAAFSDDAPYPNAGFFAQFIDMCSPARVSAAMGVIAAARACHVAIDYEIAEAENELGRALSAWDALEDE